MIGSIASAAQMPLNVLLGGCAGTDMDAMVSGIQIDSRKVRAGDLFLAIPGERHDGRQFIEQAVASDGHAAGVGQNSTAVAVIEIVCTV